jgi:hypothetical protein
VIQCHCDQFNLLVLHEVRFHTSFSQLRKRSLCLSLRAPESLVASFGNMTNQQVRLPSTPVHPPPESRSPAGLEAQNHMNQFFFECVNDQGSRIPDFCEDDSSPAFWARVPYNGGDFHVVCTTLLQQSICLTVTCRNRSHWFAPFNA